MKKILAVTILALTTSVIACGPDRVVRENTVERSYSSLLDLRPLTLCVAIGNGGSV